MRKNAGTGSSSAEKAKKTKTTATTATKKASSRTLSHAERKKLIEKVLDHYSSGKFTFASCCETTGFTEKTIRNWINADSDFSDLLKKAKQEFNEVRRGQLIELAMNGLQRLITGFHEEETEVQKIKNNRGQIIRTIEVTRKKYIQPQTTAIIFALKALDPSRLNTDKQGEEDPTEQVFLIGEKEIKF
jgi:thiamine biosynthesis lipoprotein ApbE